MSVIELNTSLIVQALMVMALGGIAKVVWQTSVGLATLMSEFKVHLNHDDERNKFVHARIDEIRTSTWRRDLLRSDAARIDAVADVTRGDKKPSKPAKAIE